MDIGGGEVLLPETLLDSAWKCWDRAEGQARKGVVTAAGQEGEEAASASFDICG